MLTITKYGKSLCYRKDGNKLGKRKNKEVRDKVTMDLLISKIKTRKEFKNTSLIEKGIPGSIGASMAKTLLRVTDNTLSTNMVYGLYGSDNIGINNESLTSVSKKIAKAIPEKYHNNENKNLVFVDGIPYNPMDELDWPISKEREKMLDAVLSEINSFGLKKNEYFLSGITLPQFELKNNTMLEQLISAKDIISKNMENSLILAQEEWSKSFPAIWNEESTSSLSFTLDNIMSYELFNIDNLVAIIDTILDKDNSEVYVISSDDSPENFLDGEIGYKVLIIKKDNFDVEDNIALEFTTYETIQEGLLKLLNEIKGDKKLQMVFHNNSTTIVMVIEKEHLEEINGLG